MADHGSLLVGIVVDPATSSQKSSGICLDQNHLVLISPESKEKNENFVDFIQNGFHSNTAREDTMDTLMHSFQQGRNCSLISFGSSKISSPYQAIGLLEPFGLLPTLMSAIFSQMIRVSSVRFVVTMCEVWNMEVRDLLLPPQSSKRRKPKLTLKQANNGCSWIQGLRTQVVANWDKLDSIIRQGIQLKHIDKHAIVSVRMQRQDANGKWQHSQSIEIVDIAAFNPSQPNKEEKITQQSCRQALIAIAQKRLGSTTTVPVFSRSLLTSLIRNSLEIPATIVIIGHIYGNSHILYHRNQQIVHWLASIRQANLVQPVLSVPEAIQWEEPEVPKAPQVLMLESQPKPLKIYLPKQHQHHGMFPAQTQRKQQQIKKMSSQWMLRNTGSDINLYAHVRRVMRKETEGGAKIVVACADGDTEMVLRHEITGEITSAPIGSVDPVLLSQDLADRAFRRAPKRQAVLACGFSGTGKTSLMVGKLNDPGIITMTYNEIVRLLGHVESGLAFHEIELSVLEIYQEKAFDLLNGSTVPRTQCELPIRESGKSGTYAEGLSRYGIANAQDMHVLMSRATAHRRTSSNRYNTSSSVSHVIYTLFLTYYDTKVRSSSIQFVDLAGFRQSETWLSTREEAAEIRSIGRSLTALGCVLRSLSLSNSNASLTATTARDHHSSSACALHVPYRNSLLTRLLERSFDQCWGSRVSIICTFAPTNLHWDETLNTIHFVHSLLAARVT
jgi:hypothetical protein